MPYKNKEDARASRMRSYYKHRDKALAKQKEYDMIRNQTEERKQYHKEWNKNNPHSQKISQWKHRGMILKENEDWKEIYDKYDKCEKCEYCNNIFKNSLDKHLDHNHNTGFIRGILCRKCNLKDILMFN